MHRIIAATLAATVCASLAQAQTSASGTVQETLTLGRALELAAATMPGIEAATAGVRAAEAQRRIARSRPNPTVSLETENAIGTGVYSGLRSAETTAALSLPLELGGKRAARIGLADAQTTRARLQTFVARADLVLRVTQAFIQAISGERRLMIGRTQLVVAEEGLRTARVRVRAGRASPLEEQRAEVARLNAANTADRAARASQLAIATLARLIDRPPGTLDASWFDDVGTSTPRPPADIEGTLALTLAKADMLAANAQVQLARSQRVPDLTLSAGARRLEATNDVAAVFGVSVPIPLFTNRRAAVDASYAQRDQAQANAGLALFEAQQAITTAETDLANAEASASTANGPALDAAQEAARIARIGYREGKFGQLDLLDAERTLVETRGAAIDALTAYHDARARLARLTDRGPNSMEDDR